MKDSGKQSRRSFMGGGFLAFPSTSFLLIFFMMPLMIVLVMSFMTRGDIPSAYEFPVTFENYREAFNDTYGSILWRSVQIALITSTICFVMGYPLAFFISTRQRQWVKNMSLFMVILPFWTNFLVRTYAWRIIIGRRGVINETIFALENMFGIDLIDKPLNIINTETAVLIGLVYGFLPFMVLPIYTTLERFDFRLVEAGHDLGANDWHVFWRIIFPVTMPGVVAGWILVFIPAIGAFVTPDLLGGTSGLMIGNLIQRQFRGAGGKWTLGSAMSIVIMALVMIALLIYFRYADEERLQQTNRKGMWSQITGKMSAVISAIWSMVMHPFRLASNWFFSNIATNKVAFDMTLRRIGKIGLYFNPLVSYIFLWAPIVLLVLFSFNDSPRSASVWKGFTTKWYQNIFQGVVGSEGSFSTENLLASLQVSLKISLTATVIATILGTMIAIALVRYKFQGKNLVDSILYLPVVIPDIAQGVSLLVFFGFFFDLWERATGSTFYAGANVFTVIIGHVAFNISFVAIVIRARLTNMNPHYEEAARDLGANHWRTFWRITYPLLLPGILAGALLAFTLSLDDFVVTFFAGSGSVTTLTIFVYGLVRRSVTPEINAVSAMMILASTVLIGISMVLQGRSASRSS